VTTAEQEVFCQLLDATFAGGLEPGGPGEAAVLRYFERVPFELAERCVDRLVMTGQVHMPKPAELVAVLRSIAPRDATGYLRRPPRREALAPSGGFDVLAAARAELAAGDREAS
jgi:hypothetical protein